jgi:hypothetical protein
MSDNERTGPHLGGPSGVHEAARPMNASKGTPSGYLNVATASRKDSTRWEQLGPVTWDGFVTWLDLEHPASERECGCYVGGLLRGGVRRREAVVSRSILTLDADKATPSFLDDVARALAGTAWAAHTTWRHGTEGSRYRLLVPLSRPLDGVGYMRVAEAVRDSLGEHWGADKGCPEPERFMYRPSTQGHYSHRVVEGTPLDVDRWLTLPLHPYAAKAIEAELARLDECDVLGWDGPPWNNTTHAVACNLIEFANSPWSGYTLDRAEDDLLEHAPTDDEFGPTQHTSCWESALRKVGDKGRPEPDGKGDPADDFDVVARVAPADTFDEDVEKAARAMRVRRAAQELLAREEREEVEVPELTILAELLDEPDEEARYRVDRLMPTGGRVVFAAPNKAGKTTMIANLVRCLVDGGDFLGRFNVEPAERVVLLDNELDRRMIRSWLRDQAIDNTKSVEVLTLRGKLSGFNILDPVVRAEWAARLGPADLMVFDCLRPALDALGLSEDKDAGRFLVALDELVAEAGIGELVVVHHMGHSNERSRGDSRILDWPDALWKLVKADAEDHGSARFFSAYGRDVDQPESQLAYDAETRRLSLCGGSRHQAKGSAVEAAVFAFVQDNPGCSGGAIERGVQGDNNAIRQARTALIAAGLLRAVDHGPGRPKQHYPGDNGASDFAEEA